MIFRCKSKVRTWKNHAVEVLTDYLSWIRFWKQFYGSGPEPFEQEMLTPEEIRDNLEVTEKGRIRQSIQNCKYVLEYDPCLRGAVCRNEMTCQIDIKKKVPWKRRGVQMTDTDMNNLSLYLEKNYGLTSDRVIGKAIDIVANDNSFHPIIDLLESLKWDGRPRIAGMLTHFFGAENPEYAGEVMKMHMLAAIWRLCISGSGRYMKKNRKSRCLYSRERKSWKLSGKEKMVDDFL